MSDAFDDPTTEPAPLESVESTTPVLVREFDVPEATTAEFAPVLLTPVRPGWIDDGSLCSPASDAGVPMPITSAVAPPTEVLAPPVLPPLSDCVPLPDNNDCKDASSVCIVCGVVPLKLSPTSKLTFWKVLAAARHRNSAGTFPDLLKERRQDDDDLIGPDRAQPLLRLNA